jgi:hypothetical protein
MEMDRVNKGPMISNNTESYPCIILFFARACIINNIELLETSSVCLHLILKL